jgi:hypothetical protein
MLGINLAKHIKDNLDMIDNSEELQCQGNPKLMNQCRNCKQYDLGQYDEINK